MMKRSLLLLLALLGAIVCGYSQSLENLGDEAFLQGKYKEAAEYYSKADKLEPSNVLKEKIKKSNTLKTEFEIIDRAISQHDYDKARQHIDIVLREDPGNLFAIERIKSTNIEQTKHERRQAFKGFYPEDFNIQKRRGISHSLGIILDLDKDDSTPLYKFSFFSFKRFPYTVDFLYQTDFNAYKKSKLKALGLGSSYFLTKRFMIDFGTGYMWNSASLTHGPYLRAGATFRFWKDFFGISYMYERGLSFGSFYNNVKGHFILLSLYLLNL